MNYTTKPSLSLDLTWQADLRFEGTSADARTVLDSEGKAGPSPVQALAFALAGCMATDVVHILIKARSAPQAFHVRLLGWRAPEDPRRLTKIALHFMVTGKVVEEKVVRAIALSREKYCSVWHSLRQDIELTTSFEIARRGAS